MTTITRPFNLIYNDDVDGKFEGDAAATPNVAMMTMMRLMTMSRRAHHVGAINEKPLLTLVSFHRVLLGP